MALNHSPKIVTSGLVLALDAANPKSYPGSGTTWADLSGNGNNGTLTNGPTFNSSNKGSIVFDGTDDYVNLGFISSINNSADKTFSMWINPTTSVTGSTNIFFGYQSLDNLTSTRSYIDDNNISGGLRIVNNGTNFGILTNIIQYGVWQNITISNQQSQINVYTGSTMRGNLTGSLDPSSISNVNFQIGFGYHSNGARRGSGNFGLVNVYNRALSAAEIQQNFNALRGRYGI